MCLPLDDRRTSVLEDLVFAPLPLNPLLFPGTAIRGVLAHDGFSATQGFTAAKVLAAVETGVAKYGTNTGRSTACCAYETRSALEIVADMSRIHCASHHYRPLPRRCACHSGRALSQAADAIIDRQEPRLCLAPHRQPVLRRLLLYSCTGLVPYGQQERPRCPSRTALAWLRAHTGRGEHTLSSTATRDGLQVLTSRLLRSRSTSTRTPRSDTALEGRTSTAVLGELSSTLGI